MRTGSEEVDQRRWAAGKLALCAAFVVFITGFPVMLSLYLMMPRDPHLPGLFAFPSATLGDSIFLPIVVGSLFYACLLLPKAPKENVVLVLALFLGLFVGTTMQAQWLLDESPDLNWTFPEPHVFNLAGIYHAFYFIFIFGFLSLLICAVSWRFFRRTESAPKGVGSAVLISVFAVAAFLGIWIAE